MQGSVLPLAHFKYVCVAVKNTWQKHKLFDDEMCEANIPIALSVTPTHKLSLFVSHRQPSDPQNIVTA